MKKAVYLLFLIIVSVFAVSCAHNDQEVLHMGLNASIVDMDTENKTLTVEDSGEKEVFGDNCVIDCTDTYIIYCNYDTGEVNDIDFEDLQTGDKAYMNHSFPFWKRAPRPLRLTRYSWAPRDLTEI